jgi:hypothetical protein
MSARSAGLTATLWGSTASFGDGSGFLRSSSADCFVSAAGLAAPSWTTMFSSSFRDSERCSTKMPATRNAQTRPPRRTRTPAVIAHSVSRLPRLGFSSLRATLDPP